MSPTWTRISSLQWTQVVLYPQGCALPFPLLVLLEHSDPSPEGLGHIVGAGDRQHLIFPTVVSLLGRGAHAVPSLAFSYGGNR